MCRRYDWDWIRGNRIQIGTVSLVGRFGVLEGPNPSLYRNNIFQDYLNTTAVNTGTLMVTQFTVLK